MASADQLTAYIASHGSLSMALCQVQVDADNCSDWNAPIHAIKRELLRLKSEAAETMDERAFRLGLRAADLDAIAERHMDAAADAAGRAAGRRLRGWDDNLAVSFDRECQSCTELALEASAEAERLRSQAGAIRRTAEPLSILSTQQAA